MKRVISLVITFLMVMSLFPFSALAEGEETVTPEPVVAEATATPEPTEAPTEAPIETPTPEPVVTPEPAPTEVLPSETPSVEALFLRFLDCDATDADGTGHVDFPCLTDETVSLKAKTETNGELSYRWQVLDPTSTADDPYVDIDTSVEPTADKEALSVLVQASMLGVKDYFRCVVTAKGGEETIVANCYFTLKASGEPTPTPELTMLPEGLDFTISGAEANVYSFAGLQSAINSGATSINVYGDITVTSNYSISSAVEIYILGSYTFTVASGITLTNNGFIGAYLGGVINISGTLANYGAINIWNGSTLNAASSSSYYPVGSYASLFVGENGTAGTCTIINVPSEYIQYDFYATSTSELIDGLGVASGYYSATISINDAFTLNANVVLPSNVFLWLDYDFTIGSGVTLTVNGSVQVPSGTTLTNHGTIQNNGDIWVDGTLNSDGSIVGDGSLYNPATASSEAQVRTAIASGKNSITVTSSFTLTADLTIPDGVTLELNAATITVPSGKTLSVEGTININTSAKLLIKSGAILANSNWIQAVTGALVVETGGTYIGLGIMGGVWQYTYSGASVSGIDKFSITIIDFAENDSQMRSALAYSGKGYFDIQVYPIKSFSLASNYTIASDMSMYIQYQGENITLTVPTGKTLTNNGSLQVNEGSTLKIVAGATFVNNGRAVIRGILDNKGTISGSEPVTYGDVDVSSWQELLDAANAHKTNIYVDSDVTLQGDLVIPKGTTLNMGQNGSSPTLVIPSGCSMLINGDLTQYGGTLKVEGGGELVNTGSGVTFDGTLNIATYGLFANYGTYQISDDGHGVFAANSYYADADASMSFNDTQGATITGLDLSLVNYWYDVNDPSDLSDAIGKAAVGYGRVDIFLYVDATLYADVELADTINLYVDNGATLTIASGKTVTLSGSIDVNPGATLAIETGAELIIQSDASLSIVGTLVNNGTITNYGNFGANAASDAALRSAIASGVTNINVSSSFSLVSNLEIPDYVSLNIDSATLTVPAGKTLSVYGSLNLANGALTVASSGKLVNGGNISLADKSTLTISSGGIYTQAEYASLSFTNGLGVINGISKDKISCSAEAATEAALRSALALTGYRDLNVTLYQSVTLSSNLTVPANVSLLIQGSWDGSSSTTLAVPSGRTLTNSGTIILLDGGTLDIRTGGTLQVNATGSLSFNGGDMIADGTVNYASGSGVSRSIYTESDLLVAITSKTTELMILGNITLTRDIAIPDDMFISIYDNATLTVPSGKTLTLGANGHMFTNGTLKVLSGGYLNLADGCNITLDNVGTLDVAGSIAFGGDNAKIYFNQSAWATLEGITGAALGHVIASSYVSNLPELQEALDLYSGSSYGGNDVYLTNSVSLNADMTVPSPVSLNVGEGCTLTVPVGKTLTIADGAMLWVFGGGKLAVNGTLKNNGQALISLSDVSGTGTIIDNSGSLMYTAEVTTQAQLKAVIDSGKRPLDINCAGFTFTSSMTIPADVFVWCIPETTGAIAAGVTLTNNGKLEIGGKFTISGTLVNNNYFIVDDYATLTNAGTFQNNGDADVYGKMINNGTVTAKSGYKVRFHGGSTKEGTKAIGTWYSLVDTPATGIQIIGPSYVGIGDSLKQQFLMEMLPADAWPMDVHWSIMSGSEFATIAEETGELTGTAEGDVVIRATALDDSTIYGEMTVHVVEYAVVVTGLDGMVAGKTLQLTGSFAPSNVTNTKIVWGLMDGDSAYASVSATGLVTAKPVTEQHTITVIASSADGAADVAFKDITIYPVLTGIQIIVDDTNVTNQTLVLNSNDAEAKLTLTSAVIPSDGMENVTWSLSATDAATMVVGEDGSVTLTPITGKTKLLTLTAKATDGSNISASVKIQVSALSSGVTVGGVASGILYAGKSAQLTATFDNPQPANRAVKWVLPSEYEAFASLSATGLLTAKAVTDAVTIAVYAVPADGGPASELYTVTIKPLATAVVIKHGESYVTGSTLTLDMGRMTTLALSAETWPDAASDEVNWSSNAPLIATVDADGVVTAIKAGMATITATAKDGSNKSATVKISVTTLPQSITAISPAEYLRGGVNANYTVKDNATGKPLASSMVRWTLAEGNAAYASITTTGALKTSVVPCVQTITLLAEVIGNEAIANTTVEVTLYPAVQTMCLWSDSYPVSGTTLLVNSAKTVPVSYSLTALILPADAQQDVLWSSSNTNIARVTADGIVTPVPNTTTGFYNKGTAVITAKAKDGSGLSASVTIQVLEGVEDISFTAPSLTPNETGVYELESGKSTQLRAVPTNLGATNKKINIFAYKGEEYVTISASGLLTAKTVYEDQTVELEAYSADGYATADITFIIKAKANPLRIMSGDGSEDYSGLWFTFDLNDDIQIADVKLDLLSMNNDGVVGNATWSVAPSYVARVVTVGGVKQLQAITTGTAVVTARATDGSTASFTVEIFRSAKSLTIAPPKGMDPENLTLASGKSMLLTGTFTADGIKPYTTKGVEWYFVDGDGGTFYTQNDYASISTSGLVTAKANLTAPMEITVRGYSQNAPYLTSNDLKITLMPIVTGLDITDSTDAVISGASILLDTAVGTMQLGTKVYPSNANQNVLWTSSNKLIATVSSEGLVTALKAGQVTITAQAADGSSKSASFKLTVAARVQDLVITSTKGFEVRGGATLQLGTAFTPTVPTDKRVTWSLAPEDAQYATITPGGLLNTKPLTHAVTIHVTATSVDNPTAAYDTVEVRICPATTKVMIVNGEGDDISGRTLTMDLNDTDLEMTLESVNLPLLSGGTMQGVVWTSSNSNVLKVSASGELTTVLNTKTGLYNTGLVTITATAADGSGKSASLKVNVAYLVSSITIAADLTVKGGLTLAIKPTFEPLYATNKAVKWTVRACDTPYATIGSTGVLTAKKLTKARDIIVYCETLDGSGIIADVTVTITP